MEKSSGLSQLDPLATVCRPGPACPNRNDGKLSRTLSRSKVPGVHSRDRTRDHKRPMLHLPRQSQSRRMLPGRQHPLRISALSNPGKFARSQRKIFRRRTSHHRLTMDLSWSPVLATHGQKRPPDSSFSNMQRDSTVRDCSGPPPTATFSWRKAAAGKSTCSGELPAMVNHSRLAFWLPVSISLKAWPSSLLATTLK